MFARNTQKYQTTHITWNAEQFVVVLHVFVFEIQPLFVEILFYFSLDLKKLKLCRGLEDAEFQIPDCHALSKSN